MCIKVLNSFFNLALSTCSNDMVFSLICAHRITATPYPSPLPHRATGGCVRHQQPGFAIYPFPLQILCFRSAHVRCGHTTNSSLPHFSFFLSFFLSDERLVFSPSLPSSLSLSFYLSSSSCSLPHSPSTSNPPAACNGPRPVEPNWMGRCDSREGLEREKRMRGGNK